MADKDLWTTFEETGSILDYLAYKGAIDVQKSKETGEREVESRDQGDRDHTVRSSYR